MTIRPTDGIAVDPKVETVDDLLSDLDMTPNAEAESDADIMAALDAADDIAAPDPVVPVADWLTDLRELARKHGPFSAVQILQIVRELDAVDDLAVEASR
jgi:hypothetical protein